MVRTLPGARVRKAKLISLLESYYMNTLAFSPEGTLLATGAGDGIIRLWSLPGGRLLRTYYAYGSVDAVAFTPGAREVVSHGADETVRIWPVREES